MNTLNDTGETSALLLLDLANEPLSSQAMLSALKPPKHFDSAEFTNYIPEPEYPSQAATLKVVTKFVHDLESANSSQSIFKKVFGSSKEGHGLYLDGGFGVGKTHLLASAYHTFNGPKAYLSFQELMFLVGLQTLTGVVAALKDYKLLVIDEFELDDPANTRISTNMLQQLFDAGVSILTSSNTPPGALGEGKFSVEDFQRELGSLTKRFKTIRIDGEDYRTTHHLNEGSSTTWVSSDAELELLITKPTGKTIDNSFDDFLMVLSKAHPMRIRNALGKVDTIILRHVAQITHPHEALRFVYAIDKAYDNNIMLLASASICIDDLFHRSYFTGGDTKKYLRTMSRLKEMVQMANVV